MKILFPLIKAGSGSDVFVGNLIQGLKNYELPADIQYLPSWSGLIPRLAGFLCDSTGYDVIHSNTWNGSAFRKDIPLVVTGHSAVRLPELSRYQSIPQKSYYKLVSRWEQSSIASAESVCCVSKFAASYLERMYGFHSAKVIYNGIDTSSFSLGNHRPEPHQKEENICTLFFAGNRRMMKGFDLLPKIMNELGDDFRLIIAAGLRSGHSATVQNTIHDLGMVSPRDMPAIYRSSDIYLFPSRLEGFGLSVAEAMACGKPVVTTNCSSLPELVIDGKGGYLCPMDDVSAFADAVRHLAEDENLRKQMGNYNRQRALDMFTIDTMTREYLRVYRKIT